MKRKVKKPEAVRGPVGKRARSLCPHHQQFYCGICKQLTGLHPSEKVRGPIARQAPKPLSWYTAKSAGGHQGLVIDENTGANIAVTYDKAHAPQIVRAVNSHEKARALALKIAADFAHDHRATIDSEPGGWAQHRKDEPGCSYCSMIEDARAFLRAIGEEA